MNGSSIQSERAWQMALEQLRLDMPKASFDTWVRDTSFVSFEDEVFTIGTPNAYGREWLASRLTSTLTRLMTGILNQPLVVEFIVIDEIHENDEDVYLEEENSAHDEHPSVLSIQAEYQSIYDEIVQKVAYFSGMSIRTFWRWVAKPETWKRLHWLLKYLA